MNSARIHRQAGKGDGFFTRRTLRALLACALVLAGGVAQAQQRDPRDYGGRDYGGGPQPERRAERFRLPQMDRDPRQMEQREPRQQEMPPRGYDDARRMQQYQQPPQGYPQQYQDPQRSRSGRMTADERAEMRRQVNEAKDFYPQRH